MLELAVETDREAVNRLACQVHAMHVGWLPDTYEMPPEMYPKERFRIICSPTAWRGRGLYEPDDPEFRWVGSEKAEGSAD